MPVLVVGAESALGRAAVASLRRAGGEVRAFADAASAGDDEALALRSLGAKVAVGDLDDEGHLEAALTRVHTVVHLAGGPLADPDEHLDAVATTVSAALGAGCRRVVLVGELPRAEATPFGAASAAAEELVADSPLEAVVLRCGLRYGRDDALTRRLLATELPAEVAAARQAPVLLRDVGAAVAAADAQRGDGPSVDVTVELVGPEELTVGELRDRLLAGGWPADGAPLPPDALTWLAADAVGGPGALGRQGTRLDTAVETVGHGTG